jgi:hypothetical protein
MVCQPLEDDMCSLLSVAYSPDGGLRVILVPLGIEAVVCIGRLRSQCVG